MNEPVALLTPFPAFRRGLAAMLAGTGFDPEEPDDPVAWMGKDGHRILLMAVARGRDVAQVVDLRNADSDVVVIALLPEISSGAVREAVLAGACSVAGWDTSPEELVALLGAGLAARSILPTPLLQELATAPESDSRLNQLDGVSLDWLRMLARGMTVTELAQQANYSEREVYRLLRALYDRLGVGGRTEALVWAAQQGIVD